MIKLFAATALLAILCAFAPARLTPEIPSDIQALLEKNGCVACHHMSRKLVGPKWTEIAAKKYSPKRIMALVKKPEPDNWMDYPPMLAQPNVPKEELARIANWLAKLP